MKFGNLSQSSLRGPRVCRGGRSNPGLLAFFLLFTFLLTPALVFATPQVPRTIVFQGILVDAGGNPLTDVPSANADISIVDGAGNLRYEEQQTITLFQGATAFLVGTGTSLDTGEPTGGIPLDVMEPGEGDLILKIKIEGQTIAQEDVILASVPFSFYSQYATQLTQLIESDQIKDGAITVSHLSEEVTTYVKSLGVSKEELEEHKTEEAAHAATSISVRNTFKNLMGTDLQMLLESVDYNITLASKASDFLEAALASDIAKAIAEHEAKDINVAHSVGKIPAERISGTIGTSQIANEAVTSEKIVDGAITASKLDQTYLSTEGGTLNGNLNMQASDITMSDGNTVDNVDVSELKNTVDVLKSTIEAIDVPAVVTDADGNAVSAKKMYLRMGSITDGKEVPWPEGYDGSGNCVCQGGVLEARAKNSSKGIYYFTAIIPSDCKGAIECKNSSEDEHGDTAPTGTTCTYIEICFVQ